MAQGLWRLSVTEVAEGLPPFYLGGCLPVGRSPLSGPVSKKSGRFERVTMNRTEIAKVIGMLKCLLRGLPVTVDDHAYRLADDFSLCLVAEKIECGSGKHSAVLLKTDLDLGGFIKLASEMDDSDFVDIVYQNAMQS